MLPFARDHDHRVHPLQSAFREEVRHMLHVFQQDLVEGRLQKKWLDEARVASGRRANGEFDEWKEREREEYWGQKAVLPQAGGEKTVVIE